MAALAIAGFCSDQPQNTPLLPCPESAPGTPSCIPSKKELKQAKRAFAAGLKLQKSNHMDEALDQFETAARLSPRNVDYATAREMTRQQLIYSYIEKGNTALLKGNQVEALGSLRAALHLDPQNEFVQQRLRDAVGDRAPRPAGPPQVIQDSGEVHVSPQDVRADFHYQGDSRGLLSQIAQVYRVESRV